MHLGAEEHVDSPWDSIFLNDIQAIPYAAYNFGMCAMIGRTITEMVGTGADVIQGCNLLYGAKQTGKSLCLKNLQRWFPPSQQGDIPDSAEEQWWSAHLVNPVTHETVKLVTCKELSHRCKVPMTEWQ
jgi:hypothetical protein